MIFTDDGGTPRSIILRQSNAEIARDNGTVIGDVVEDGERWQADGTTSEADGQAAGRRRPAFSMPSTPTCSGAATRNHRR